MDSVYTLQELADMAVGLHHHINFNMLHALLHGIIDTMAIAEVNVVLPEETQKWFRGVARPTGNSSSSGFHHQLTERIATLEGHWDKLNRLPTEQTLAAKVAAVSVIEMGAEPTHAVGEIYQNMRMNEDIEQNKKHVAELIEKVNELMQFAEKMRAFNDQLHEMMISSTDKPGGLAAAFEELSVVVAEADAVKATLNDLASFLGKTTTPSDAYFNNLPTFALLEELLNDKYDETVDPDERRLQGERPISKELVAMFEELGSMVKGNIDKLAQTANFEELLRQTIKDGATKAEFQKMAIKMAEVQGIAGAVDRLLCRIQGSEDQICCLRQVVNKIYSCISQSVSAEAAQQILSCLSGAPGGSAAKINSFEDEIKAFQMALSKIQCELDTMRIAIGNCETVKTDVQNLFSIVNELDENKLDKCVLATELALKADKSHLDDKVGQNCFEITCDGLNQVINDILAKILESDVEWQKIISYLTTCIEAKSERDDVDSLRDQMETKLRCLAKRLIALQRKAGGESGHVGYVHEQQLPISWERILQRAPKEFIPSPISGLSGGKTIKSFQPGELELGHLSSFCQSCQTDPKKRTDEDPSPVNGPHDGINVRGMSESDMLDALDNSPTSGSQYTASGPSMAAMKDFVFSARDVLTHALSKAKNSQSNKNKCDVEGMSQTRSSARNNSNNSNNESDAEMKPRDGGLGFPVSDSPDDVTETSADQQKNRVDSWTKPERRDFSP